MAADLKTYTSLGRFLGESNEEVEKYFRKIERLHTKLAYTDQNKANMIPFGLEGKALDFYETFSEETKENYNEAKAALTSKDFWGPAINCDELQRGNGKCKGKGKDKGKCKERKVKVNVKVK